MIKKIYLIITCIAALGTSNLFSQVPDWTWAKSAGGSLGEDIKGLATDNNGNVFVTGNFYSSSITFGSTTLTNAGQNDIFLAKYDRNGNALWAKGAGGSGYDFGKAVATDNAGNVYVTGNFQSSSISFGSTTLVSAGAEDIFIAKFDGSGVLQYEYRLGGAGSDQGFAITTDDADNVYFAANYNNSVTLGGFTVTSVGGSDVVIGKISPSGTVLWLKSAGGSSGETPGGICTDAFGNIIVTGMFYGSTMNIGPFVLNNVAASNYQIYTAKYDPSGNVLWANSCGSTSTDVPYSVTTDTAANIYICGYISASFNFAGIPLAFSSSSDIFLAKYSPSGAELWGKSIGGSGTDTPYAVKTDQNNNVYICGDFGSAGVNFGNTILNTTGTGRDIFLAKYNELGTEQWATSVGAGFQDYSFAMDIDPAGSVIIGGSTGSTSLTFGTNTVTPVGSYDVYVAKMSTLVPPLICMVSVDTMSNYNLIYWDKTPYTGVDSFIVYRETTINNYKKIGAVHHDSLSMLIDTVRYAYFPNTGNPNQGTYKYKLQIKSVLGDSSLMSPWHKSIFVNQTGGVFTFNDYSIESQPVPVPELNQYLLYRDDNSTGVWNLLSANTSSPMNDPAYASYPNASWRVETDWTITCDPTRASVNTTRSNIKHNGLSVGIPEKNITGLVSVFPNPANNVSKIEVNGLSAGAHIHIINAVGQLMYDETFDTAGSSAVTKQIDISGFSKGIYMISVESNGTRAFKKLVIQ